MTITFMIPANINEFGLSVFDIAESVTPIVHKTVEEAKAYCEAINKEEFETLEEEYKELNWEELKDRFIAETYLDAEAGCWVITKGENQ